MLTYILAWLLIGVLTFAYDMTKSLPSHPVLWIVALAIHLILGGFIAAVMIAKVTLHVTGFVTGSIASAFMRGFNKGYDR